MSSLTIDSGITREYQLHLIMSEQSQSIANNTTTIAYELRLTSGSYNFGSYGAGWEVWINGTRVAYHDRNLSDRYSIAKNSYWTIASGTTTVTHSADGTKTIACSASLDMAGSPAPGPLSCPSTNWTLTTIPRKSTMTVPTFTIESSGTMTISAYSTSFTHTITYSFEGLTGTAASVAAGVTSASWTPPSTFYAKLPSSTSGTVTLVLHTYSGGTEIGSNSYTATVNVGSGIKPTAPSVTLSPVNTNAWLNTKGLYVGGYTKLKVDSSATAGSGASISSYSISGAVSGSGSSYTSGVLTAGSKSVTVTATDSRGRTNSTTKSVTFQSYSNPSFSTFTYQRGTYSNGTWTAFAYGNHVRVEAVGSVSLSASGNTGTKTVKIGNTSPAATSGNYYYFTNTNAATAYTVSGSITDSVGNTGTSSLSVAASPSSSTLSIPTLTIGSASTLTVSAASNAFTHTITYSFSGLSGTIASLNAGVTTTSWTPPTTFYAKLPNATSGTVSIVIKTYSGGTEIGSNSYNATVYVGSGIKPTAPSVTLSPVNSNAWISGKGIYVSGYTRIRVQSSATAGSGASMSSYTISGAFAGTGADVTSSVLSGSGTKSVTVTAADSRGRTNATTQTVSYLAYSSPSLTTFNAVRGTYAGGSWTSDETGDHIRVEASGTVSLSANGNTGTITVKIGATNPDATSGNYYYFTSTNGTTSYTITGTITDSVGNTTTRGLTVSTIAVPFNINVDLPGIGVGMIAQTAKRLEIAQDWSLVANGKNNTFAYMPYSWVARGTSGLTGYARIATVNTKGNTWVQGNITFEVTRLIDFAPFHLYLSFEGTSNTDPNVAGFYRDRNPYVAGAASTAFVYKVGTHIWDVYVQKVAGGDAFTVTVYADQQMQDKTDITFSENLLASAPSGAITASYFPQWKYVHGSAPATPTLTNATGTVSVNIFRLWENYENTEYAVEARIRISNFTRTGANFYLQMQTDARPQSTISGVSAGFRTKGGGGEALVPEFIQMSLYASGVILFQVTETYWNAVSGGDMWLIIPHIRFGIDR